MFRCNLCGEIILDYGNNPYPLMINDDDRCCDSCNLMYVIPARICGADREFSKKELAKITRNIRMDNANAKLKAELETELEGMEEDGDEDVDE